MELRERDKQYDVRWADSMLRLFTCETVEEFWEAWYHTPTIRYSRGVLPTHPPTASVPLPPNPFTITPTPCSSGPASLMMAAGHGHLYGVRRAVFVSLQ